MPVATVHEQRVAWFERHVWLHPHRRAIIMACYGDTARWLDDIPCRLYLFVCLFVYFNLFPDPKVLMKGTTLARYWLWRAALFHPSYVALQCCSGTCTDLIFCVAYFSYRSYGSLRPSPPLRRSPTPFGGTPRYIRTHLWCIFCHFICNRCQHFFPPSVCHFGVFL